MRYMSEEHAEAADAIQNFKRSCEARNVDYADAFLCGDLTVEEYKKVHINPQGRWPPVFKGGFLLQ